MLRTRTFGRLFTKWRLESKGLTISYRSINCVRGTYEVRGAGDGARAEHALLMHEATMVHSEVKQHRLCSDCNCPPSSTPPRATRVSGGALSQSNRSGEVEISSRLMYCALQGGNSAVPQLLACGPSMGKPPCYRFLDQLPGIYASEMRHQCRRYTEQPAASHSTLYECLLFTFFSLCGVAPQINGYF